jgi:hypothetical protein
MPRLVIPAFAAFALSLSSCLSGGTETEKPVAASTKTESSDGGAATSKDEKAAAEAKAAETKAKARVRKLEKRAHDLEIARSELEISELDTAAKDKESQIKLDEAGRALDEARQALEHFNSRKLPQTLADARLDLDRSTQNKVEAEQELREMEATYAKDQFALDTKELVLMRHRKRLEFATRSLELAEQRFSDKEKVELPRERRELERKLREAEQKVRESEVALKKTQMSNSVELTKKRFQVAELERPLEDDDEAGAKTEKVSGNGGESKKGS